MHESLVKYDQIIIQVGVLNQTILILTNTMLIIVLFLSILPYFMQTLIVGWKSYSNPLANDVNKS